jgi:CHRD domain
MRKAVLLGLVALLGVLTISTVAFAGRGKGNGNGNGKNFSARLNGWEEDPSQVTTGRGSFRATANTTSIAFELSYENLETVAPANTVLAAHIHIGGRSESGAISAFLCGVPTQPACPAGPNASITGTILAEDIVASGAAQGVEAGNFADLLRAMRRGETYVNVHTATRAPGGEVRGQIKKGGNGVGNGNGDDDDD